MTARLSLTRFVLLNAVVWVVMTVILVIVPDALERWLSFELSRVVGWAVAGTVWVVAVERHWQARAGPLARFFPQLVLWVSAALVSGWISGLAR
jgi:hypothetical protein